MSVPKNEIILADCMDIMKDMPDDYIDLAIVDPPYTDDFKTGNWVETCAKQKSYKNKIDILKNKKPNQKYFDELLRVSKNQIIWGGNYFTDKLKVNRCWLSWYKSKQDNYFSDFELAWTSFDKICKQFNFVWSGMLQENMKNKEKRIHPTQKPIQLYRWLLQQYAKPGQLILDTHSGSGSLACACHLEKFDFIAIEKDKDYHRDSVARLNELRAQGVLF